MRQTESLIDYRKRVLDSISPSFCGAKWLNATIWLNSGTTASCHLPIAHRIDDDDLDSHPARIHNTLYKKEQRKLMLEGKRPKECEYCWKLEDMDVNAVSDRILKSMIYSDEQLTALATVPWERDIVPTTLEVAFDRLCSCACAYCNPSFSSRWENDIQQNGPYQGLQSDGARAYEQDGSWVNPFSTPSENPYLRAFWKWWPSLSDSLTEIRVTGGEPMLSPEFWKLLDALQGRSIALGVNSNLSVPDSVMDRFIQGVKAIPSVSVFASAESVPPLIEYVRDGLQFDVFMSNIRRLLNETHISPLVIMMTVDALALWGMLDFLDGILELKRESPQKTILCSINILRYPSFMSPLVLPVSLREERASSIESWLQRHQDSALLDTIERESLKRLVNYLRLVEEPHLRATEEQRQCRERDFKSFYCQYDQRRKKNHQQVFPAPLLQWMDTIVLLPSSESTPLTYGFFSTNNDYKKYYEEK